MAPKIVEDRNQEKQLIDLYESAQSANIRGTWSLSDTVLGTEKTDKPDAASANVFDFTSQPGLLPSGHPGWPHVPR